MGNKFEWILSNDINGNLTDYATAVKKLTKLEMLRYIEYCQSMGMPRHNTISRMANALNK